MQLEWSPFTRTNDNRPKQNDDARAYLEGAVVAGDKPLLLTEWTKASGDDASDDDALDDAAASAAHFAVATSCAREDTTCYQTVISLGTLAAGTSYTFMLTSTDVKVGNAS